jgi:hypothetical protein
MKPKLTLCLVRAVVTALSAFAGAACMQTPANPLGDVSGFCQEKAKAECQVTAVCAIDPSLCTTYRESLCNSDASSAMASGVRQYVPGSAQACLDALNAAYGNGSSAPVLAILFAQLESITDTCERVFSGTAGTNVSCQSDYDCANNAICALVPGSASRVCAPPVASTQFCFPGSICPTDMYCAAQPNGAAICVAAAAAGQTCSASVPCVSDERCAGTACADRVTSGGACVTSSDCAAGDPYCDPNGGSVCTIGLTFAHGADDCRAYVPSGAQTVTVGPEVDSGGADAADATAE